MMPRSLNARMLLSVSILLIVFFGLAAGALDYLFRDASLNAIEDHLEAESLVLMAAAEEDDGKLVPVKEQLDVRFLTPNSGLYGEIATSDGKGLWRSHSLLNNKLSTVSRLRPGQTHFGSSRLADGTRVVIRSVGYAWEFSDRQSRNLVFSVAESEEPYFKQLSRFRWQLFGGFAIMTAILVASLLLLMRTVLRPLRTVESEIKQIESGAIQQLTDRYPRELAGVASNMNRLLRNERERMERYRNSLGNLAHSLKTPLAVIRNMLTTSETLDANKLDHQVTLMDDIVRYQLKRAAVSAGATTGATSITLNDAILPLRDTLQKAYFDKHMHCEVIIENDVTVVCDKNDLLEIAGNLLDNAFKYGKTKIRVMASIVAGPKVKMTVEDDGQGIPIEQRQYVLQRGARLDERQSGQGIGLSVVNELATLYRGTTEIDQSEMGGACVTVTLPCV